MLHFITFHNVSIREMHNSGLLILIKKNSKTDEHSIPKSLKFDHSKQFTRLLSREYAYT